MDKLGISYNYLDPRANRRMQLSTRRLRQLIPSAIVNVSNTSACGTTSPAYPIKFLRITVEKCVDRVGRRSGNGIEIPSEFPAASQSAVPGETGGDYGDTRGGCGSRLGDSESCEGGEANEL